MIEFQPSWPVIQPGQVLPRSGAWVPAFEDRPPKYLGREVRVLMNWRRSCYCLTVDNLEGDYIVLACSPREPVILSAFLRLGIGSLLDVFGQPLPKLDPVEVRRDNEALASSKDDEPGLFDLFKALPS